VQVAARIVDPIIAGFNTGEYVWGISEGLPRDGLVKAVGSSRCDNRTAQHAVPAKFPHAWQPEVMAIYVLQLILILGHKVII